MNILFVTEQFPYPLDTGGNVRTFNLLRGLASAHDVTLVATSRGPLQEPHRRTVADLCRAVKVVPIPHRGIWREALAFAMSLPRRTPYVLARHCYEGVLREIAAAFAWENGAGNGSGPPFDAVHFNHLDAALYQAVIPANVPCVLDQHNVVTNQVRTTAASEGNLLRRLVLAGEHRKLRRFEASACNRTARCLVCSEADGESLRALGVTRPIRVVPNGVDLTYFKASFAARAVPRELVFVGTLDYEPCERGLWFFCREILPLLHREMPELRFVAVGRNPSARLLALARADSRIELTGRVDDVRPHVSRASVFVVPLLSGSGTRLKILEAFALGTAVVTTAIGAEGIAASHGEHMLVADEPAQFARSVLELLRDPQAAARLATAARALVEARYGWEAVCESLLEVYRELSE